MCVIILRKEVFYLDNETKVSLGKILGNIYLIQKNQGVCEQSDSHIFGLLNGVEQSLNTELENGDYISNEKITVVEDALLPYVTGEKEYENHLNTTIRLDLEHTKGINQVEFINICKFLSGRDRKSVV